MGKIHLLRPVLGSLYKSGPVFNSGGGRDFYSPVSDMSLLYKVKVVQGVSRALMIVAGHG